MLRTLPSAADFAACVGDAGYYAGTQNRCDRQIAPRPRIDSCPGAKIGALFRNWRSGDGSDAGRTNGHNSMAAQHFGPEARGLEHGGMALLSLQESASSCQFCLDSENPSRWSPPRTLTARDAWCFCGITLDVLSHKAVTPVTLFRRVMRGVIASKPSSRRRSLPGVRRLRRAAGRGARFSMQSRLRGRLGARLWLPFDRGRAPPQAIARSRSARGHPAARTRERLPRAPSSSVVATGSSDQSTWAVSAAVIFDGVGQGRGNRGCVAAIVEHEHPAAVRVAGRGQTGN